MSSKISSRPAILAAQISQMISGLKKYESDFTRTGPTQADLESNLNNLTSAMQAQQIAMGAKETATQQMYAARDCALVCTRRMRDSIYAFYGKNDAKIVEFGLDTPKYGKSAKTETSTTDAGTSENNT